MGDKNFWVVHGDDFDGITRYHKWVAVLGDYGYTILLWANRHFNKFRAFFNLGYWSLSAYLKHKVKSAVNFIFEFESALVHETKKKGYDGVVCGHIHHPEIREVDGILYCNDGDWVESCSAIVEKDGNLEIIYPIKMIQIDNRKFI
jgi:UDP-2,3-diacylglucosamine pyrophosphatase LpxH